MFIMLCHKLCVFFAFNRHNLLKGPSFKRFFGIFLFNESNPPRPLINMVKWFCKYFYFRGDNGEIKSSMLCYASRSQTQNTGTKRGARLHAS